MLLASVCRKGFQKTYALSKKKWAKDNTIPLRMADQTFGAKIASLWPQQTKEIDYGKGRSRQS